MRRIDSRKPVDVGQGETRPDVIGILVKALTAGLRMSYCPAVAGAPDCRHGLVNSRYTVHYTDGRRERRWLTDADQAIELLAEVFGVRRDDDATARRRIQTLLDQARAD